MKHYQNDFYIIVVATMVVATIVAIMALSTIYFSSSSSIDLVHLYQSTMPLMQPFTITMGVEGEAEYELLLVENPHLFGMFLVAYPSI